ncbi:MAG: hypothetical protein AAF547_25305 [Actinomycetota bacterium]
MRTSRNWWWVPLVAVFALVLKAGLLAPWVAAAVEDAAVSALQEEGLDQVSFVSVDGVDGPFATGMQVTLTGPAIDRSLAIAVVSATDEIDGVTYRSSDRSSG